MAEQVQMTQRVDIDRQALHEALLDRVGNAGGSGGIRSRTHAGLVGVQAALDAKHHHRAGEAAEDGLEVEGRLSNIRPNTAGQLR